MMSRKLFATARWLVSVMMSLAVVISGIVMTAPKANAVAVQTGVIVYNYDENETVKVCSGHFPEIRLGTTGCLWWGTLAPQGDRTRLSRAVVLRVGNPYKCLRVSRKTGGPYGRTLSYTTWRPAADRRVVLRAPSAGVAHYVVSRYYPDTTGRC